MQYSNLENPQHIEYNTVFSMWKNNEGKLESWQEFATKVKGFPSWSDWRMSICTTFKLDTFNWTLFTIQNPLKFLPNMLLGPFKGWQRHYPLNQWGSHTFNDLITDHNEWVKNNSGIHRFPNVFTNELFFIGFLIKETNQYVLFEGHHRTAHLTFQNSLNNQVLFQKKPQIAIAEISIKDFQKMIDFLKNEEKKLS